MENGGQIKSWGAHGAGVFSVEYCRDGRIVSSGRDKTAKLWDTNGGAIRSFEAFNDLALQATHCDETDRVVAGDWTGEIRVWAAADGTRLGNLSTNPPTLEERLAQSQALVAPATEKAGLVSGERETALAALKTQQEKVATATVTWQAADRKKTDQLAVVATEEQKLAAEQAKEKELTEKVGVLQKAIPELKSASAKAAEALELTKVDEELKKVVEQLQAQVTAREAELNGKDGELSVAKAEVVKLAGNVEAQKKTLAADEQALVTAKAAVDSETAALAPYDKAAQEKEVALATAQQELTRANGLVDRWQNYIALRDELTALDAAKKSRDAAQLASLEVEAELEQQQSAMAAVAKTVEESRTAMTAMEKKAEEVTAAMAAVNGQMVAQQDLMTRTQNAVPSIKAALEQVRGALALLPDNAEIKSSIENLAAVADRQEKSIPVMTEQIAVMKTQVETMTVEIETAKKASAESNVAMTAAAEKEKALAAEVAPVEVRVREMQGQLATAEQAVQAASGVVEARRQTLRPLLQLTSVK